MQNLEYLFLKEGFLCKRFLAVKIVDEDQTLCNFLDQLEYNKKNGIKQKKLNSTDAKSIFDAIEQQSPWEND